MASVLGDGTMMAWHGLVGVVVVLGTGAARYVRDRLGP
jgi:hypothetical protein